MTDSLRPEEEQELLRDAWSELASATPPTVLVYPALAVFCAAASPYATDHPKLTAAWFFVLLVAGLVRLYASRPARPRLLMTACLGVGLLWGSFNASAAWLYQFGWATQLTMVVSVGLIAGATSTLSTHIGLFRFYSLAMLLPGALMLCVIGGREALSSVPLFIYLIFILASARLHYRRYWKAARSERLLQRRTRELEQASQAKSQFLATMSHEIRTPMNAIFGMTELLKDSPLSATQRQWLNTLRGSCETLLALLSDILDLSRVEAGKLELEHRDFDLSEVLRTHLSVFTPLAQEKGLSLHVNLSALGDEFWIRGDSTRIGQVVSSLLSNAIKFTEEGSIQFQASLGPDWAQISVQDTGEGIPANRLAELFQPFSQLDSSHTRRFGGSGRGLALCRRLAELMRGHTWVVSGDQRFGDLPADAPLESVRPGSRFYFRWPLQAAESATESESTNLPPSEIRILIAEDNLVNRKVIQSLLERLGYRAHLVGDGAQVLQACANEPFDLIFMDVQMPHLDGLAATRALRQQPGGPYIIALTANAFSEDREQCLTAGMNDYLSKPIRPQELERALGDYWKLQTSAT